MALFISYTSSKNNNFPGNILILKWCYPVYATYNLYFPVLAEDNFTERQRLLRLEIKENQEYFQLDVSGYHGYIRYWDQQNQFFR